MSSAGGRPDAASVALLAPAKVNLFLHVVGRRADGYHELETIFAFTDLADRVEVTAAAGLTLATDGPFAQSLPENQESNLAIRAARALAEAAGVPAKAAIRLTKNLPVSAGLGSGSSDAAAVLKALAQLWNIDRATVDLHAIGLSLGADVPACITARSAFVTGIGERIEEMSLPEVGLLLVNPRVELSTASVFNARRGGFTPEVALSGLPADAADLAAFLADKANDLTEPAMRLGPVVREVLQAIEGLPGCLLSRMSGSGSTCYGLFATPTAARDAASGLDGREWWVAPTRIVPGDASLPTE